jgi:hypothetical protein
VCRGARIVLCNPLAAFVQTAEVVLRVGVSLLGGFAVPAGSLGVVLSHPRGGELRVGVGDGLQHLRAAELRAAERREQVGVGEVAERRPGLLTSGAP